MLSIYERDRTTGNVESVGPSSPTDSLQDLWLAWGVGLGTFNVTTHRQWHVLPTVS